VHCDCVTRLDHPDVEDSLAVGDAHIATVNEHPLTRLDGIHDGALDGTFAA
jgi:hypothetical protein